MRVNRFEERVSEGFVKSLNACACRLVEQGFPTCLRTRAPGCVRHNERSSPSAWSPYRLPKMSATAVASASFGSTMSSMSSNSENRSSELVAVGNVYGGRRTSSVRRRIALSVIAGSGETPRYSIASVRSADGSDPRTARAASVLPSVIAARLYRSGRSPQAGGWGRGCLRRND